MTNLPPKSNRKIDTSLLLAMATVFLVVQPGMGFILVVLLIPLLIWLGYSAYRMLRWPETRRNQLLRVAIWLVALALMVGIHYWLTSAGRVDSRSNPPFSLALVTLNDDKLISRRLSQ